MSTFAARRVLTVADVADLAQVDERTVRRAAAAGTLPALRLAPGGRLIRFRPFTATAVHRRARLRWSKVTPKPLAPIGLHEARHTFASMAIAAGVNAKALTEFMGHASIETTFDR